MMIAERFARIGKAPLYLTIGVLTLSTLAFAATAFAYRTKYVQLARASGIGANPSAASAKTTDQLIEEISQLITLPTGEKPTVATVADPEKLKSQPFFAQTVVGDKVLIYPKAHEAILYRPSEHKLIAVGPFSANVTSAKP